MAMMTKGCFTPLPSNPLLDSCAQHSALSLKQKASKELCLEAKRHFKSNPPPPIINYTFDYENPRHSLADVFSKYQGLCVGEQHHDPYFKRLIIENLTPLATIGVTTLFLEHLEHDILQTELDQWLNTPEGTPPPDPLQERLHALDKKYGLLDSPYSFTQLVLKTKAAGLRIVCLDTSISKVAGTNNSSPTKQPDRILAMNYVGQQILKQEMNGKYLVLTGINHVTHTSSIPSLAEIMQCPYIRS